MILGENKKTKFNLDEPYADEWVELRTADSSAIKLDTTAHDYALRVVLAHLSGWSVTDKDGRPLAINIANLERCPIDWFNQVAVKIREMTETNPKAN